MSIKKIKKIALILLMLIILVIIIRHMVFERLTIIVPNDYVGSVSLVLSNIDEDILTVDSNGIGYLTENTFNKSQLEPQIYNVDGHNVTHRSVGFSPSAFWSLGKTSYAKIEGTDDEPAMIEYLSFELVPENKIGVKQYYHVDLLKLIDREKVLPIGQ